MNGIFDQKGRFWHTSLIFLLIFFIGSSILTWLILFIDDTNYGTANGLWKSVFVNDYMHHREQIDYTNLEELSYVSNLLYFPVYAFLIQFSPLRFMDLIIVQKMAIINAWFGGLSLAAFYLLMYAVLKDHLTSIIATLGHFAGGMFIAVSTNSEDIIPAYAFFVISLVCMIKYIKDGSTRWLILTSVNFAVSWLFQWTMAVGPAPAFALVILMKQRNLRATLKHWLIFAGTNILIVIGCAFYFQADFVQILWPGKSIGSGWITGLSWDKPVLLYTGFINYIIGGFQFLGMDHFLDTLLGGPWYYPSFIAGSLLFLVLTIHALYFFINHKNDSLLVGFGVFLLVNFLFAQLMNMIEFATDLQFHIQPMIWLPIAFGLFFYNLTNSPEDSKFKLVKWFPKPVIIIAFLVMPVLLFAYNVKKFKLPFRKGLDSYYMDQLKLVEANTDLDNTFFVTRGWDEFRNWGYSYWGRSFRFNTITITDFLRDYPNEASAAAANRLIDTVAARIGSGYTVLAGPEIIDRDEFEIIFMYEGFQQTDKTKKLLYTVKNDFVLTPYLKTELGTFYKMELK